MPSNSRRIQETSQRARGLKFESIIRELASHADRRLATRKQVEGRRSSLLRQVNNDTEVARVRVERILKGNELTDISYLALGLASARSVCRVVIGGNRRPGGYGTGFLVAPGVLLTNHHVLPTIADVRQSIAQFRYERDAHGADLTPVEFALMLAPTPILFKDLDLALVAVEPRSAKGEPLDPFGWLQLNPEPGKAFIGEWLTIIQHPNGERKQICVRENRLLKYSENGPYLWYQTDTVGGSSGSPVFNNSWDVVALHHSGVPKTARVDGKDVWLAKNGRPWKPEMGEDQVEWIANEGVRISRICEYLRAQHGGHPLAQRVLTATEAQMNDAFAGGGTGLRGAQVLPAGNGTARIIVPVEIDVRMGHGNGIESIESSAAPKSPPPPPDVLPSPGVIEKVEINQDNYAERTGYNPKFLGSDLLVPLPKVIGMKFGKPLPIAGTRCELKYWNYSVVMNRMRRLAFFSAANVDADKFRGSTGSSTRTTRSAACGSASKNPPSKH